MNREAAREAISVLLRLKNPSRDEVNRVKTRIAQKYGLTQVPRNSEIIEHLEPDERRKVLRLLRRKPVRTASGVTVVAVMTKPWPCPQGQPCAYCPGGPSKGVPQSYTGLEPAAMRGSQNGYDAYGQVRHRVEQYGAIGHAVDKIELIIMGGTFPSTPQSYQEEFVKGCLDAMNGQPSESIVEAKRLAETSRVRNVGITVETRPDWAGEGNVDQMLSLGVTRVEVGVQNVYDDVYELVGRGHKVEDVVSATRVLKDSGLKVVYHMMPGLPGSSLGRDVEGFKTVFNNPGFKPDMLKVYPCLVIEGTRLYEWWKQGKYTPYTVDETVELISEAKKYVPELVRIMRVQRDIPAYLIEDGVKKSNLRELVQERLRDEGRRCRCIRCREAGHRWLRDRVAPDYGQVELLTTTYEASGGTEHFVSLEDRTNDVLIGYVRLRFPSQKAHRPEIRGGDAAVVRELRVCGPVVPVGKHAREAQQHRGFGRRLLGEAERLSRDNSYRKILVTSALGTKRYYRRLGYGYNGPYVSKKLKV